MNRLTSLAIKSCLLRRFCRFSSTLPTSQAALLQKAQKIQQAQPYFDRLIYIDPDYLAYVPLIFKPLEPVMNSITQIMFSVNDLLQLPWWAIIMGSCVIIRLTILPLMFVQMRKINQLAPIAPVLVHLKNTYKQSNLPRRKKIWMFMRSLLQIVHSQNLKFNRLFLYNIVNYTFIITMVYSIRKLLAEPIVGDSSFLHISALSGIDPFFILPVTTIVLYYYNFQRFITPQNKDTLISRIRAFCQVLLILWLPFLCYWPSGIVIYMFTNALTSVIQSTVFMSPSFLKKISPKFLIYNFLLGIAEYDKAKSESIVETIRTGEESLKDKAISEETLVQQTEKMVAKLNEELTVPEELDDTHKKSPKTENEKKHSR